jgi:hypothetical protein
MSADLVFLRAFAEVFGRPVTDRHEPVKSDAELAYEDHLESIAEDRAFWGRWGGSEQDADRAALRWENDLERQWEGR